MLQQLLAGHPTVNPYRQLVVGIETGDDAAVWQLDDGTCEIATTDFFMPMVDDPYDFGRIAATNAISDVYAMGGTRSWPGHPGNARRKVAGRDGAQDSRRRHCGLRNSRDPGGRGHSIDCPEPVYGLAVIGTCRKEDVRRNADARPGDAIILTKPLGVGIYAAGSRRALFPTLATRK